MASGRYDNRVKRFNRAELYFELLQKRGVKQIHQYLTPQLHTLSASERAGITTTKHIWKTGDRFYKLAHQYYGDVEYWWIIPWYNQLPTENHVPLGQVLYIPFPAEMLASKYMELRNG